MGSKEFGVIAVGAVITGIALYLLGKRKIETVAVNADIPVAVNADIPVAVNTDIPPYHQADINPLVITPPLPTPPEPLYHDSYVNPLVTTPPLPTPPEPLYYDPYVNPLVTTPPEVPVGTTSKGNYISDYYAYKARGGKLGILAWRAQTGVVIESAPTTPQPVYYETLTPIINGVPYTPVLPGGVEPPLTPIEVPVGVTSQGNYIGDYEAYKARGGELGILAWRALARGY